MSIYATLWKLKFPKEGDEHSDCEWIEVTAQAVPPHVGSPTPGNGYESGDPFAVFLPPAVETDSDGLAKSKRMSRWRQWLYAVMSRNAQSANSFYRIPPNRVIELGMQIEI